MRLRFTPLVERLADAPATVTDALRQWRAREIFPTDLASVDLRGLSAELRLRAVFSARTTNANYLAEIAEVLDDMLAGKISMADGKLRLFRKLRQLGYDPEVGFPDDMAAIPPAERGSLQDLSSDARLHLVLETNQRIAANYGRVVAGNTPYARHAYPAWELVRLYKRDVPRGTPESHSPGWEARWEDAGEAVEWEGAIPAPHVARKDSPIWSALGNGAGGYADTLGNPFPPFAFNSGLGWREVERARCVALGLITDDEAPEEMEAQLTPDEAQANAIFDGLPSDLQQELRRELASDREREFLRQSEEEHRAEQDARRRERLARMEEDRAAGRRMLEEWLS